MRRRTLSDDALYEKMEKLLEEKRLYLRKSLSRDDVARELLTNRTYVTRALEGRGLRFPQFVNAFRACHALALMMDDAYRDVPPADIAEMSGFSSVDTMNRYIKKSAGSTACAVRERIRGRD